MISQYPDLEKVGEEVANWDRTEGHDKAQALMQGNPDIKGVLAGNDEMALGAIAALKEAGKLEDVIVGGFDGAPDAVEAVKNGEMAYTVLQPVAQFSGDGRRAGGRLHPHGHGARDGEAGDRLHPDHRRERR